MSPIIVCTYPSDLYFYFSVKANTIISICFRIDWFYIHQCFIAKIYPTAKILISRKMSESFFYIHRTCQIKTFKHIANSINWYIFENSDFPEATNPVFSIRIGKKIYFIYGRWKINFSSFKYKKIWKSVFECKNSRKFRLSGYGNSAIRRTNYQNTVQFWSVCSYVQQRFRRVFIKCVIQSISAVGVWKLLKFFLKFFVNLVCFFIAFLIHALHISIRNKDRRFCPKVFFMLFIKFFTDKNNSFYNRCILNGNFFIVRNYDDCL